MPDNKTMFVALIAIFAVAAILFGTYGVSKAINPTDSSTFYMAFYGNLRCTAELQEAVSVDGYVQSGSTLTCPPDPSTTTNSTDVNSIRAKTTTNCEVSVFNPPIDPAFLSTQAYDIPVSLCTATTGAVSSNDVCTEKYKFKTTVSGAWYTLDPLGSTYGQIFTYYKFGSIKQINYFLGLFPNAQEIKLQYRERFTPYILIAEGKGSLQVPVTTVQQGCYVPLTLNSQIFKEDYRSRLEKGQVINYVDSWVVAPIQGNVYSLEGTNVTCAGNLAYPLVQRTLSNGQTVWIESTNGKIVQCCPYQPGCGQDFKFSTTVSKVGQTCTIFDKQVTSFFPSTMGFVAQYSCANGVWVEINKKANQCYQGCGVNEICDENFNCISLGAYITPEGTVPSNAVGVVSGNQQGFPVDLMLWVIAIIVIIIVVISVVVKLFRS